MSRSIHCFAVICMFATACASTDDVDISTIDDDIIGGTTDTGDPAIVAVFAHAAGSTSGSLCTGTIIAPTKVLTAAHCVDPAVVGAGQVFEVLTGTPISLSNNLGTVASTTFDPAWDPNNITNGHDVGIVTLQNATSIHPLPYNTGTYTSQLAAAPIRIVGYGTNNHTGGGAGTKRMATTTVRDFNSLYLHIGTNSKENCHGDSGGPALQTIGGVETVVGITSYGTDLGTLYQCLGGGYDTRADVYAGFIASH